MKYQIWYRRSWPLAMPSSNLKMVLRYARRLRDAYGNKEDIRIRKIPA